MVVRMPTGLAFGNRGGESLSPVTGRTEVVMQSVRKRRRPIGTLVLLPILASMLLSGCGNVGSNPSGVTLNVPHRQQLPDSWDYCGPANVLMWRRANGYGEVSQHTIYNSMGIGGSGTNPQDLALAVQDWAHVSQASFEVAACDEGPYDEREIISARQITSIDNGVPIIVIVDAGFHAVIAIGGEWHHDSSTGLEVWDEAYFNDPRLTQGNVHYGAGRWIDWFTAGFTCEQVFDQGAVGNAGYNLSEFGDQVVAYGYDGPRPGGDPIAK